jgi:hypothetical protein
MRILSEREEGDRSFRGIINSGISSSDRLDACAVIIFRVRRFLEGGRGLSVASWPNGGGTAEAELMQNPVATTAKCIAERDRVKAAM